MADSRVLSGAQTLENFNILDPIEVARGLATLNDETLEHALPPIAERLAQSPELAAEFVDQIIQETIRLGLDLNPLLVVFLRNRLEQIELTNDAIETALNGLANNQPELIDIFKSLDPEVQRQFGALYVYLQINRGISADAYFQLAKSLNLPKLPKELWDIRRFQVSNTGRINPDAPVDLEYTPEKSVPEEM